MQPLLKWQASSSMEPFVHDPLELGRGQIRLIEVLPSEQPHIRCRIRTFEQSCCPEYVAVSYVWGDERDARTITINGRSFLVKVNLHTFLRVVSSMLLKACGQRRSVAPFLLPAAHLWIDQLSIDQSRADERNDQVRRMTEIFTQATAVIAWLGEGDATSDKAMKIIAEQSMNQEDSLTSQSSAAANKARSKKYRRGMAVTPLFCRTYWTRLWIAQEFILPKNLFLVCGELTITWTQLRSYYRSMLASSMSLEVFKEAEIFIIFRDGMHSMDGVVRTPKDPERLDIALIWFTHLDCKDPRDKVYGLLGLVRPGDRIHIDYKKEPSQIFWEVIRATNLGLGICNTQFKLLGWSMGVTGNEQAAAACQTTFQYRSIFGTQKACDVFSEAARLKWQTQSGSFIGSEKEIAQSLARLELRVRPS